MTDVNPFCLCYSSAGLPGLAQYGAHVGIAITGRENRDAPEFAALMAAGGEVLAYINVVSYPETMTGDHDRDYYENEDAPAEKLWPFPSYGARVNYIHPTTAKKTYLTDMRPGSDWFNWSLRYCTQLLAEFDGPFCDSMNTQIVHPVADWKNWPAAEQLLYAEGLSQFVVELDKIRKARDDMRLIVCNGITHIPETNGLLARMRAAMDGCMIEHHPSTRNAARDAAMREYGTLGHRRVLVITRDDEANAVEKWKVIPGVTHISDQQSYGVPTPPPVPFVDTRAPELEAKVERLQNVVDVQEGEIASLTNDVAELKEKNDVLSAKMGAAVTVLTS